MKYNFDELIDRRNSDSIKWKLYGDDVLPFWVADMDFKSPQPVIDALINRVEHGVFGYPEEDKSLKELICHRMSKLYKWDVISEDIVFLPGVVNGFNLVIQALTDPGKEVLIQTPVYHPFLSAPQNAGAKKVEAPLKMDQNHRYSIDFDQFEDAISENTQLFLLCNPHNPVGRVFTKDELSRMAEICFTHDLYICSDEIHADIVFNGFQHVPIASLDKEIAHKTITLMAPSKTYNIAGLGMSFAIAQNHELRDKLIQAKRGIVAHVNVLGMTAASAAYKYGDEWVNQLLVYLWDNWTMMVEFINTNLPEIKVTPQEGTYLAWLDCRQLQLDNPYEFFLKHAKVSFNDGKIFGSGGEGFVRLNFGCPRNMLLEGLQRMKNALDQVRK